MIETDEKEHQKIIEPYQSVKIWSNMDSNIEARDFLNIFETEVHF